MHTCIHVTCTLQNTLQNHATDTHAATPTQKATGRLAASHPGTLSAAVAHLCTRYCWREGARGLHEKSSGKEKNQNKKQTTKTVFFCLLGQTPNQTAWVRYVQEGDHSPKRPPAGMTGTQRVTSAVKPQEPPRKGAEYKSWSRPPSRKERVVPFVPAGINVMGWGGGGSDPKESSRKLKKQTNNTW